MGPMHTGFGLKQGCSVFIDTLKNFIVISEIQGFNKYVEMND
jgi:hypothetical protein